MTVSVGATGIWTSSHQWPEDPGALAEAAAELDELGFGALWLGGSAGDLALHQRLLDATGRIVVASGIVDVWRTDSATVASAFARTTAAHPGRFLLGLGSGHAKIVESTTGHRYVRPLAKLASFLDDLDAADPPVPAGDRVLAALRPKALALSAARSAGAHPYLATPDHTARARDVLGAGPLLAPEQKVVLETDPATARALGRQRLAMYLDLPNYLNNLRDIGFDDADFADGGSDRLVDALVAWGDAETIAARLDEHRAAGADHVIAQVLGARARDLPLDGWRALAAAGFTG